MKGKVDKLLEGVWGRNIGWYSRLLAALGTHLPDAVKHFKEVVEYLTWLQTISRTWGPGFLSLSNHPSFPGPGSCSHKWVFWSLVTHRQPSVPFISVYLLSHVWLFATPWTTACQASLSITNSRSSPKPMFIELVMPSNHLILCHPLLLLPSIFPTNRVFFVPLPTCLIIPWHISYLAPMKAITMRELATSFRICLWASP